MIQSIPEEKDRFHSQVYQQVKNLFQIEDMSGVEVFSSLGRILQMVGMMEGHSDEDNQAISGPRFRLLLHLFLAEQMGKARGITPTELSHFQQVSKNTVSALLRGLEEQGYIERELDPEDLRMFHIRLSRTGRELMLEITPSRIQSMNQMLVGMEDEEVSQLIQLLTKLRRSLEGQFCHSHQK